MKGRSKTELLQDADKPFPAVSHGDFDHTRLSFGRAVLVMEAKSGRIKYSKHFSFLKGFQMIRSVAAIFLQ